MSSTAVIPPRLLHVCLFNVALALATRTFLHVIGWFVVRVTVAAAPVPNPVMQQAAAGKDARRCCKWCLPLSAVVAEASETIHRALFDVDRAHVETDCTPF